MSADHEALARLLCRQFYGQKGRSTPGIVNIVDENWRCWMDDAAEVVALLAQPPQPDAGEWVRALGPFMPTEIRENQDYAEVTFGEHQTQAMSMAPNDWLVLNELYNRAMIASPPKQEGQLARNPGQLEASTQQEGVAGWRPTHRHVKRGTDYAVVGEATLQANEPQYDDDRLTIYRDKDGHLWARPLKEFGDGRFEPLPHPPSGEGR